ncbi:MAG: hypothetical protein C0502_04960 [Opitutus sp.]|nr:hypothetical protein [Opitutus sp.]
MPNDAELLCRYARENDQRAFGEFVQRHMALVYGAALRRTSGRSDLAEEVAQRVFADAARKAWGLAAHPSLAGWLHQATRYATIDALREETRRAQLAQRWAAMNESEPTAVALPDWERLRPVLDEALDRLSPRDREVVLLRFFAGLPHAEVGARLGLAENAARMRAERALERLRAHLGRRGVVLTATALGLVLASQPAVAAPAGLAAVATQSASTVPAAGTLTILLMNKAILAVAGVMIAGGATGWLWMERSGGKPRQTAMAPTRVVRHEEIPMRRDAADGPSQHAEMERAEALARQVAQHRARREAAADAAEPPVAPGGGHRDRGRATPREAIMTLAWAQDGADVEALAGLVCFEGEEGRYAQDFWGGLPEGWRAQFDSPEKLYALLLAADAVVAPPPPPEIFERFTQLARGEDEVELVPPGFQAQGMFRFRRTNDGWKWILPSPAVRDLPRQILADKPAARPAGG